MPRLPHGATITVAQFEDTRSALAGRSGDLALAFVAAAPVDVQDFDFLFGDLQANPGNLLPEARATRDGLIELGRSMSEPGRDPAGNSTIPAVYTYLGQFIDHDITLETASASLAALLAEDMAPLAVSWIKSTIRNLRSATLDLDSVYGITAPRDGAKMQLGVVTGLSGASKPLLRPPGKGDDNDLPREPRSTVPEHDRAALIGDPRNDENTIIAQLHVAFLKAHNRLVEEGKSFEEARTLLRQHYQHIVIQDFLKRIADPVVVDRILQYGNRVYDALVEPFFLPLEFSVAAYRFGHSMVRAAYDFNLNFNLSGEAGTNPATLNLLFTFTALSSGLGFGAGNDTLPDNWIVEWENLVGTGRPGGTARKLDTNLVEPLFHLTRIDGTEELGDGARLAVRNLLRGYLLRLPTGQAVARKLELTPLTAAEMEAAAGSPAQVTALRNGAFLERTPLWYYLLAEAAHGGGNHLGPVGSTLVAEVLIGLARRSDDSILRTPGWAPTLPSATPGQFELADLLRFARVLA